MYWYQFVSNAIERPTNYLLSEAFGNNQSAWKAYEKGERQPNDAFLELVNSVIPGSIDAYSDGPNGGKLWASLSTNNFKDLHAIKIMGKNLEKDIVRFRLAAIEGRIPERATVYEKPIRAFDLKLNSLEKKLISELGKLLAGKAISILRDEIEPYKEIAEYESNSYFLDFITEDRPSPESAARARLEMNYSVIEMPGLKNKGSKSDNSSNGNLDIDFIRIKLGLPNDHQKDELPF